MKKIIAVILLTLSLFTFTSCGNDEATYNIDDLYKVERVENFLYQYTVTDKNGNVLVTDKIHKQPHINIIDDKVLSVSIQYGTGLSTRDTTYYNVDTGEISETYTYILGEYNNKTIDVDFDSTTNTHMIIVRDIFDKSIYYKETILPDAEVASDCVVEWKITDDGIANITYLKGNDYTETNISIDLK